MLCLATFSLCQAPSTPPRPPARPPSPSAPDFSCVDSSFEEINIAGEESTSTSLSVPRQGIASSLQIEWWHQCPAGVSFTLVAPDSSELEIFGPSAWVHAGTAYQANTSPLCGSLQALTVFEDVSVIVSVWKGGSLPPSTALIAKRLATRGADSDFLTFLGRVSRT